MELVAKTAPEFFKSFKETVLFPTSPTLIKESEFIFFDFICPLFSMFLYLFSLRIYFH